MQPLPESNGPRILVVDDDESIVDLVATRLMMAGYRTIKATDGFEAIRHLKDHRPHAMVLDINMPGLDGFGVLEHMAKPASHKAATLVLTARHNAGDVEKAIRLGAKDYLAKPFDDRLLLARVARLVRRVATPL
jgi:DNA-binding response OmpR family regulator